MTRTEYERFTDELYTDIRALLAAKNADYAEEADPFANFKQSAEFGVVGAATNKRIHWGSILRGAGRKRPSHSLFNATNQTIQGNSLVG